MDRALSATVSRFATTVSIVLLATACGESRRLPTAPLSAPLRPPPPQPPFPVPPDDRTITGSVLGYSSHGVEPLAGIDVWRWIESEAFGYTRGAVRTDAAGRFSFEAPSGVLVRLFASSGEFSQPCLATVGAAQGEATVRLVAGADRTRASDLTGLILGPTLTGTVFESTAAGPLPIADAWVEVDGAGGNGLLLASTRTAGDGRYLVCGLEGDRPQVLLVSKEGYQIVDARTPIGGAGVLDIELHR